MLQENDAGKTPVNLLIQSDPPLKRLERLLDFELLPRESFANCEDDLIDFITRKVIKNQSDSKLKAKLVFSSEALNKRYYEVFGNDMQAYSKQKDSFSKRGYEELFDKTFSVQDYEQRLKGGSQVAFQPETSLYWERHSNYIIAKPIEK